MDEMRRLQKVGYSTLSVSIPSDFAKDLGLHAGDTLLVREEADGTMRLIPAVSAKRVSKASIKADQVDGEDLIPKLIIGCYALGYDTIEVDTQVAGQMMHERIARQLGHFCAVRGQDRRVAHRAEDGQMVALGERRRFIGRPVDDDARAPRGVPRFVRQHLERQQRAVAATRSLKDESAADDNKLTGVVDLLIDIRKDARKRKDYATSDKIRNQLLQLGIVLKDKKDGGVSYTFS